MGDTGNAGSQGGDRLSEDDLNRIQREFSNAIRSVNISLIEDYISRPELTETSTRKDTT